MKSLVGIVKSSEQQELKICTVIFRYNKHQRRRTKNHVISRAALKCPYNTTRKPTVTGGKVILFVSIFGSQFLSHRKISVTTKDIAELIIKSSLR